MNRFVEGENDILMAVWNYAVMALDGFGWEDNVKKICESAEEVWKVADTPIKLSISRLQGFVKSNAPSVLIKGELQILIKRIDRKLGGEAANQIDLSRN